MPLLIIAFGVALQVYLTYKKISPFLSLLIVAIIVGLLLGIHPSELVVSIEKGVGSTLSGLALIICLGAVLGKILEVSGAINQITSNGGFNVQRNKSIFLISLFKYIVFKI